MGRKVVQGYGDAGVIWAKILLSPSKRSAQQWLRFCGPIKLTERISQVVDGNGNVRVLSSKCLLSNR